MKRIILFSTLLSLFFLASGQQGNGDFNTLNVRNNFGPPIQDTLSLPYKLGEMRTRPQDGRSYRYNGKAIGQQRWDFMYYGPLPSVTPTLDQVLNNGSISALGFTAGPVTLGSIKVPTLGQNGSILMVAVNPDGSFTALPIPGAGTQITSINALNAAAQFLRTSFTSATTSPVWGDVTATHTLNIPLANALDTGIVTPTQIALWNGKYTLPGGGTVNQYLNGLGNLVAFPVIPDTGRFTVIGSGLMITGNPKWPDLKFTITGGGGGISSLSGDVAGTGSGAVATTIQANVVSYAKMQTATSAVLLGNPTGGTANISQITLARGLIFNGTTILVDSTQYVTNKKLNDSLRVRDSVFTVLPLYVSHGPIIDTLRAKNDSAAWNAKAIQGIPVNNAALANNFVLSYNSGTNTIVWVAQTGGGGGATNLSATRFLNFDTVYSSTGTAARLDTADPTHAGLMSVYAYNYTHHFIKIREGYFTPGVTDSVMYGVNDTLFMKGDYAGLGIKHIITRDSVTTLIDTNVVKQYTAKPGGSNTQLQYNNVGVFAGMTTIYDGTSMIFPTLTNAPSWRLGEIGYQATTDNNVIMTYNTYINGGVWIRRIADAVAGQQFLNGTIAFFQNPTGLIGSSYTPTSTLVMWNGGSSQFYGPSTDLAVASVEVVGNTSNPNLPLSLHNGTITTANVKFGVSTAGVMTITPTGAVTTHAGIINYDINRGSSYTVRTLTDKRYVDSAIAANVAAVGGYVFQFSLTNTSGTVNLVGDAASPGNSMYYGTNPSGTKGFFVLPTTPGIQAVFTKDNTLTTNTGFNLNSQFFTIYNGTFGVGHTSQSKIVFYNAASVGSWWIGRSVGNADGNDFNIFDMNANASRFSIDATGRIQIPKGLYIPDGTQGAGKVLTSDALGITSWQTLPSSTAQGIENVITTNPTLSHDNTVNTAGFRFIVNEVTGTMSVQGSTQSSMALTDAAGTNRYLIGRSPANDNAQAFFIRDLATASNPLTIDNFGVTTLTGLKTNLFTYTDGNQGAFNVLTSNVNGIASWSNMQMSVSGIGVTNSSASGGITVNSIILSNINGYRIGTSKHMWCTGQANISITSTGTIFSFNVNLTTPATGTAGPCGNGFLYSATGFIFPAYVQLLNSTTMSVAYLIPVGSYPNCTWEATFDYQ